MGQAPEFGAGASNTPLYLASTYPQASPGVTRGYAYSRSGNPTRRAYEDCLASLESGTRGFAFASGLAATTTVLGLLSQGEHVIACHDIYGGSMRLFDRVLARFGMTFDCVDLADASIAARMSNDFSGYASSRRSDLPALKAVNLAAFESIHASLAGRLVAEINALVCPDWRFSQQRELDELIGKPNTVSFVAEATRGADLTSGHNARHRLTHGMAERAHAASAMRKLQFLMASLESPCPVGRQ